MHTYIKLKKYTKTNLSSYRCTIRCCRYSSCSQKYVNLTYRPKGSDNLINVTILDYQFYKLYQFVQFSPFKALTKIQTRIIDAPKLTGHNFTFILHLMRKRMPEDAQHNIPRFNDSKSPEDADYDSLFECTLNVFFTNSPTRNEVMSETESIIDIVFERFEIDFRQNFTFESAKDNI